MDYRALDVVQPGSVVLFSAQLGDGDPLRWIGSDPQLQRWLRAHQDVAQIVRMWPVRGPDDPKTAGPAHRQAASALSLDPLVPDRQRTRHRVA